MSEDIAAAPEAADPTALSLALTGASRAEADAFLRDQRHHLHEQSSQIHLDIWEKKLGVLLRLATLCVGLAVAGGLALMVWDAAHSKGLLIEPLSVPPDMTAKGLTGQVVASQLLDKLTRMNQAESSRAIQSYANNWGDDIKVEIPETGVSIGEFRRMLREWLGHDTRISGEVYRSGNGIAVTARAGAEEGATFTGKEEELEALLQQSAEHIYEITQPYRYANYLDRNYSPQGAAQRVAKAAAIYRKLIAGDNVVERAWAWNGLGTIASRWQSDSRLAAIYYRKALATVPDFTIGYYALSSRNNVLNQEEDDFRNSREASRLLHRSSVPDLNPSYARSSRLSADNHVLTYQGDFAAAIPVARAGAELPDDFSVLARGTFINSGFSAMVRRHDMAAVRGYQRDLGIRDIAPTFGNARYWYDMAREDWRDILALEADLRRQIASPIGKSSFRGLRGFYEQNRWAYALARARLGKVVEAEKMIAPTPGDDDQGLRVRALIAEQRGQQARADWWFARSEKHTPSLPLTDLMWGQALLKRGQPDAAIEKFTRANKLGPKYADPLEGWGEALMAKNQSHRALAKFAEAAKYAPNWGRLHLKWGQALTYAGKRDEAKTHFVRAAALDLTPAEKAELAKQP